MQKEKLKRKSYGLPITDSRLRREAGQSILEVIVAMAIFGLISAAMIAMVTGSFIGLTQGGEQTQAEALGAEGVEAVKAIYDEAWNGLSYATSSVSISGGKWIFDGEGTTETIGQFTRTISFADVCRDGSDNITACPGNYTDAHSKEVTATVTWDTRDGVSNTVQRIAYITNWDSREWTQTNWIGGTGQTQWSDTTKYNSGSNVDHSNSGQLQLAAAPDGTWVMSGGTEVTDTSDTDFNQGTFSNTTTTGSGNDTSIVLTQSASWTEHSASQSVTIQDLNDIDTVSASEIWAVAIKGETFHWNGTNWLAGTDVGNFNLQAVDMFSSSDGWTVDDKGKIYHYDGTSWSENTDTGNEEWYAVETISAGDVWVVGKDGDAAHYNGSSWTESTPSNKDLLGIDSAASDDIWVVGNDGLILHYNGTSWSNTSSPTSAKLQDVLAISATDAWAVGESGTIIHWDGSSWSTVSSPTGNRLRSMSAVSASDIWAVGDSGTIIHYNGTSWSTISSPTGLQLNGISMVSASDGWAVGTGGLILQYSNVYASSGTFQSRIIDSGETTTDWDTVRWTETLPAGSDVTLAVRTGNTATPDVSWSGWSSEFADASGSTIEVSDQRYLQYRITLSRGSTLTETSQVDDVTIIYNAPTTNTLNDLIVITTSDVWAVGDGGTIIHWDGSSWSTVSSPTGNRLRGVHAVSASNIWVVGDSGTIIHWDGTSWSTVSSPGSDALYSVSMVTAGDGWAVGDSGKILHYDGVSWSENTDTGANSWRSVYLVDASDGWVVGNQGLIYQWDGTSWNSHTDSGGTTWESVYLLSSSDGWAVGNQGLIYRWNGTSWSEHTDTGADKWNSVFLVNTNDGWVVGDSGNIRRWLGSAWLSFISPTTRNLNALAVDSATSGWAVGESGTILRFSRDSLYVTSGNTVSSAFDMGDASPVQIIEWDETIPSCSPACDITIDVSSAPDSGGSPSTWTSWQNATTPKGTLLSISLNSNQWVRYRATFAGDGNDTPVLGEVRVNYK